MQAPGDTNGIPRGEISNGRFSWISGTRSEFRTALPSPDPPAVAEQSFEILAPLQHPDALVDLVRIFVHGAVRPL